MPLPLSGVKVTSRPAVSSAPIQDLREVMAHPQTAATGMVQPVPGLDLELMGLPISIDRAHPSIRRRPPGLGERNAEMIGGAVATAHQAPGAGS